MQLERSGTPQFLDTLPNLQLAQNPFMIITAALHKVLPYSSSTRLLVATAAMVKETQPLASPAGG